MTFSIDRWRRLYVLHDDIRLCVSTHIVGPSPLPPLLEVAVPPHIPGGYPYQDIPNLDSISIESLITTQALVELGYQNALIKALYKFMENVRAGIETHGSELGDYYRRRYPKLRAWVEYLILLNDLPSDNLSRRQTQESRNIRQRLCQAIVFLALSIMRPNEEAASSLKQMDQAQMMRKLRASLVIEYETLHECPRDNIDSVCLVRHILSRVGGRQDATQIKLLSNGCSDADIPAVFCTLMGAPEIAFCRTRLLTNTWIKQLSDSRIFMNTRVDSALIQSFTRNLRFPDSVLAISLPPTWTEALPMGLWQSLRVFVVDASAVCQFFCQPRNAERIYSIWVYLQHGRCPLLRNRIQPKAEIIFAEASCSLLGMPSTPPQMVLDLMSMFCISRLFPKYEPISQRYSSSIHALNTIFQTNSRANMTSALTGLLASFLRVLTADDFPQQDLRLAYFIRLIGLPHTLLELNAGHSDQYWADRIANNISHFEAFSSLCRRIGEFPVTLAPLRLIKTEESEGGRE